MYLPMLYAMRLPLDASYYLVQLALLCFLNNALGQDVEGTNARQQVIPLSLLSSTDLTAKVSSLPVDPLYTLLGSFAHVSPQSFAGVETDNCQECTDSVFRDSLASATGGSGSTMASSQTNHFVVAYEVNRPTRVLPDKEALKGCTMILVEHSFSNSYGKPAIAAYSPSNLDADCRDPTKWVFIQMDVTGSGKGRQYDRLGSVQLDGIEVLRTDNQEPSANGTRWQFSKEMNKYYDVFRKDRTLVFDLPNIVNVNYTSPLDYTLALTVYVPDSSGTSQRQPLSSSYPVILPLSKKDFSGNSFFNIGEEPESTASGMTRVTFPNNAKAALVEIYASGTAKDEFWYTNLPDSAFTQAGGQAYNYAYGRGPLRELQVIIDGRLAGIAQPYPVIFTGGISPYFWRPQVSYGAFDQPTYYVDVSPFIGQLTDDRAHEITLDVVSAERNQSVQSWFVSGNVQVMLDSSKQRTTGNITSYSAPIAGQYTNSALVSGNVSTTGFISAHTRTMGTSRSIHIEGTIKPGSSSQPYTVSWQQDTTYSNENQIQNVTAVTHQSASGNSRSVHNGQALLSNDFQFDLDVTSRVQDYTVEHTYVQQLSFGPAANQTFKEPSLQKISLSQHGTAHNVVKNGQLADGQGAMSASYSYEDSDQYSFGRDNSVRGQRVVSDSVSGSLASKAVPVQ